MRDIREIVDEVEAITSVDSTELDRLDALAVEYFSHTGAPEHLGVWFRSFERFPESDGYGVFWSILHGIEAQPESDAHVVNSVQRNPTHFPLLMVNRILNSGQSTVGEIALLGLLQSVVADESTSTGARLDAEGYLKYRRNQG